MQENWDFVASKVSCRLLLRRATLFASDVRPAPKAEVLSHTFPWKAWTIYFIYSSSGELTAAHRFTLDRLKRLSRKLCVVIACPREKIPMKELWQADAVLWKGLSGYDFSAYSLALREVATRSPSADVLVLNDSVLGPFGDIEQLLSQARWSFVGFSATAERENHIQSYAFHMRQLTLDKLATLNSVFLPGMCMKSYRGVVLLQETRLARRAQSAFSVGALWYDAAVERPLLTQPFQLLEQGFPFLKRSLLGKESHMQKPQQVRERLSQLGHPLV